MNEKILDQFGDSILHLHLSNGKKSGFVSLVAPEGYVAGFFDTKDKSQFDKLVLEHCRLYNPVQYPNIKNSIDFAQAKKEKYKGQPYFYNGKLGTKFFPENASYVWKATYQKPERATAKEIIGSLFNFEMTGEDNLIDTMDLTKLDIALKDFYERYGNIGEYFEDRAVAYIQ